MHSQAGRDQKKQVQVMKKYAITFGEIMMRLSTTGHNRFTQSESFKVVYGGAEANVSIALSKLGIDASHVTRLPQNDLGKAVIEYLDRHRVQTSFIQFGEERLGLYFLENGSMHRAPKIIYDRFDSAFANLRPGQFDWTAIMQQASWFHWTGITPAISQATADVCLEAIQAANRFGVPVSGDINYRRNLWQYGKKAIDVMPALVHGTQFVIAGESDLQNCLAITGSDFQDAAMKTMQYYASIKKIAHTNRQTLSASHNRIEGLIFDGNRTYSSRQFDLTHIVDRVGGGDAFMAGLIYGWMKPMNDQQTVEFATAASALKHSIEGDANLSTLEEVIALVKDENTGKLLR
jgi:2-dehydro-3-deoxygluconokinase